jgi:hypothetical protein
MLQAGSERICQMTGRRAPGVLPKRADPVAGAFAGTLVLAALLAPPVLIVWLVLWARRRFNGSGGAK